MKLYPNGNLRILWYFSQWSIFALHTYYPGTRNQAVRENRDGRARGIMPIIVGGEVEGVKLRGHMIH